MRRYLRVSISYILAAWVCCSMPMQGFSEEICYSQYWPVVDEIVQHMTLEQKIGHMTVVPIQMLFTSDGVFAPSLITTYHLGAVFNAASEAPDGKGAVSSSLFSAANFANATMENYQQLTAVLNAQMVPISWNESGQPQTVNIPILLGTDAVHGNQHVLGSILFPHNIGLAAAHNPQLLFDCAYLTAKETLKSGCNWIFAPTTNLAFNYQWGRTYETMGINPRDVLINGQQYVRGLQLVDANKRVLTGALATGKHFLGLGGTTQGADEGDVSSQLPHTALLKSCLPEILGPLLASSGSIMCAYNAINDVPMSVNEPFLNQILKQGKGSGILYDGFVVSDYEAVAKAALQGLPTTPNHMPYEEAVKRSIESGMDMFMISPAGPHQSIEGFQTIIKNLVLSGQVPMSRIDDAVRRILAVKYAMGLINKQQETSVWVSNERPEFPERELKQAHELALQAAEESLVLLKNDREILPAKPQELKYVILLGQRMLSVQTDDQGTRQLTLFQDFNNIGAQNGGWSVRWQGFEGNDFWQGALKEQSHASSILDGLQYLKSLYPQIQILYPQYSSYTDPDIIHKESLQFISMLQQIDDMSKENTLIITTLAESPYAEYMGDVNISYCLNNPNDFMNGCLYNLHYNAYTAPQQISTLAIQWDTLAEGVIRLVKGKNSAIPLVTVLFSGRPMVVTEPSPDGQLSAPLPTSDAFIAAWLPGTAGGAALTNAIFGQYLFRSGDSETGANTLPVDWLKNMDQLQNYPVFSGEELPRINDPLFTIGYGLATVSK